MLEGLKRKQGAWVKPGNKNTNFGTRKVDGETKTGKAPGSFGDFIYVRAPPADYKKTAQQKKIGKAAKECAAPGKDLKDIQSCVADQFD